MMELASMTKLEFLNLVSKANDTGEDKFKAQYNSPELMWDKVISKMKEPKRIGIVGIATNQSHLLAHTLHALQQKNITFIAPEQMQKPSPFDSPSMLIRNYRDENKPISVLGLEAHSPKRNSRFTPKKKKRKKKK